MEFLVADAERLFAEGGKVKNLSFWAYKIMTRSTLPCYQAPPLFPRVVAAPPTNFISGDGYVDFCAWHRYSDFEWLVEMLESKYPGVIFPPIPDKDADGTVDKLSDLFSGKETETSKDNEFVQKRLRHLQLFFDVLTTMKDVHECELIKAFVTMEEPEWLAFKDRHSLTVKPRGWDAFKSKGLGLLSRISAIGDKKPVAFPENHVVAGFRDKQKDICENLREATIQLHFIKVKGQYVPELKTETSDGDATAVTAIKVIPPPLIYNGHFVCEMTDRSKQGVVRHVEGPTAWIDWGNDTPLARIPLTQLVYPPSTVSDPTMFAAQELASQIDSFCTYLSYRPEYSQLERLMDLTYFWSKYAQRVVHVTEVLQASLEDLFHEERDLAKKKDGAEKVELAAKVAVMKDRYERGTQVILESYRTFRSMQRKALLDMAFLFGNLSVNFLCDNEWEGRLHRADAALPLLFEPPQEVIDTLTQEAKAASMQAEYTSVKPVAVAVMMAPPQQVTTPPNQSSMASNTAVSGGSAAVYTWSPSPAPAASSTPPQQPTAPPVDDVVPPPPPPQEAEENTAPRQHAYSGFEENWQTAPRKWSTVAPPAIAEDTAPPPPPPAHEA